MSYEKNIIDHTKRGGSMAAIKKVELVGESPNNWDEAIRNVIAKAQASLRGITRIRVEEFDVLMKEDNIDAFQVRTMVSFRKERN